MLNNPFSNSQLDSVINLLMTDNTISYNDKMALVSQLKNLSPQEVSSLNITSLTSTLGGGGIAAAIAKFLFGLGKRGTIVSALLGAFTGFNIGERINSANNPKTSYSPFLNFKDIYGRSL